MKSLTNCENPSRNPLQEACLGFSKAACDHERCSEIRQWSWKLKAIHESTLENIDIEREGKPEQKFDAAFATALQIV